MVDHFGLVVNAMTVVGTLAACTEQAVVEYGADSIDA
jgi:hypothetical protein